MDIHDFQAGLWLALVLIWIPLRAPAMGRRMREHGLDRARLHPRLVFSLFWLGIVTLVIDWNDLRIWRELLVFPPRGLLWIGWCIAIYLGLWIATLLQSKALRGSDAGALALLPRNRREMAWFALLSCLAGVSEEYVYRGYALAHLARWGVPIVLAALLVAISFAFAHGYQSRTGIARAGLLGAAMAIPVIATGSLLPSVISHAAIDLWSGLATPPIARRLGIPIDLETGIEPEPPPAG
jgi:membrane protease YdiL (CAAX protease family)